MIQYINSFLFPLEKFIKKNRKYIGYFFIFLSFASFGFFFYPNSTKESGEKAIFVLWVILWIPIFARVFGLHIAREILPLRKELGILMGTLAFVHGAGYISWYPSQILDASFWWQGGFLSYLAFGFFALAFSIPLTLTSSDWAMQKLGKNWKRLHRMTYLIIIFAVIHVELIRVSNNFDFFPVIFLGLYFIGKIFEWNGIKFFKVENIKYPIGQQWLCIPCGYIYDPLLWDEDSGIVPGTEFSDIPESWRCPVCGVTKVDFVPYEEWQAVATHAAIVVDKTLLNPTTIELVIETEEDFTSKLGQFVSFLWSDSEWEFTRSYSIVRHDVHRFTFLIKLDELGRGSHILRNILTGADIRIKWVFGNFILQDSKNPKIFIATGTGLAPIYNMINSLLVPVIPGLSRDPAQPGTTGFLPPQEWQEPQEQQKMSLYFTVASQAELFYAEKLRAIPNLDLHIHTTRESVEWCDLGRVDVDTIPATPETEWYICGSPRMVTEAVDNLTAKGYTRIYKEEF